MARLRAQGRWRSSIILEGGRISLDGGGRWCIDPLQQTHAGWSHPVSVGRRQRPCCVLAWGLMPPGSLLAQDTVDRDEALLVNLPEGPGKEEAFYACRGCHSFRLVVQQGLSRKHWDETLDWMIEEQGMPQLDDEERRLILDYLEANYNETRTPK